MKRFLVLAAMAVSALSAFPNSADASCSVHSALPFRVTLNATAATIYFRPHVIGNSVISTYPALSSNYWTATVPTTTSAGTTLVDAATDAVTHQTKIALTGNVATCPATNVIASIGNVTTLVLNP